MKKQKARKKSTSSPAEDSSKNPEVRFVPTSFDGDDLELRAFAIPQSWRWTSCEDALLQHKARGVMMHLPLFWQLEPALYAACRAVHAPIFINDPRNLPVAAAALRSAGIDTVVSEVADATALSSYLHEKKSARPKLWFIVHRANNLEWDLPGGLLGEGEAVVQEVQLFPGMPVLIQCTHLAAKKSPRFHRSKNDVSAFKLPFTLREEGRCSCGEIIVGRA